MVGTPIGNLEDASVRCLRVLSTVGVVAAEDTRVTRKLLARYEIATPLLSFHDHTSPDRRAALLARLEKEDVALVSDAGTPGVSDPGALLVRDALAAGHPVVAVPGPSAVTAALSVSGLDGDAYVFVGFLPRRAKERRDLLSDLASEPRTLVAFEAPHRLRACLDDMTGAFGPDRTVAVAREITKLHEETWRGRLEDAVAHWRATAPRGEFVLVVEGAPAAAGSAATDWSDGEVIAAAEALRSDGLGAREASRQVAAESGRRARDVYELIHRERWGGEDT